MVAHLSANTAAKRFRPEVGSRWWETQALDVSLAPISMNSCSSPQATVRSHRRAHAHSALSAVVLKWSRSRKRYERQGLLVQEQALLRAEEECLADEPLRERRRERESIRRAGLDERYVAEFAARIRQLYPACPRKRQTEIAEGACLKK